MFNKLFEMTLQLWGHKVNNLTLLRAHGCRFGWIIYYDYNKDELVGDSS